MKSTSTLALPLQAPRPKTELVLPYGAYRLTRADGARVERLDKHPFCMSRVYYDATEKPEEVRAGAAAAKPHLTQMLGVRVLVVASLG